MWSRDEFETLVPKEAGNESYAKSASEEIAPERRASPGWFSQLLTLFTVHRLLKHSTQETKNCLTMLNVMSQQIDGLRRDMAAIQMHINHLNRRQADDAALLTKLHNAAILNLPG